MLTRMKIATNSPKQSNIGTATDQIRERHKFRGSAAKTNKSGIARTTPSVSPAHHVVQFDGNSPGRTAPNAHIAANERLALVRQNTGESTSNSTRSRGLSNGTG